jgi:glycerophosphoryl diester phosphodiesterase
MNFKLTLLLAVLMAGLGMCAFELSAAEPTAAQALVARPGLLIIAHRGNSSAAPENTLPAFAEAVALKADLVELDYHHTADGVPLVIHDKELDRTTNATKLWGGKKLAVSKYKLAELAALDAGVWFDAKFKGTRLPTLDQALDVIQNGSVTLIEHKAGDAKTCLALLEKKGLLDKVVVQSFDWDFLADCRRLNPTVVLGALGEKELTPAKLAQIDALGVQAVGWSHKSISASEIKLLHDHGYKSWVYTVDDPGRAKELIAAGLDGLITNVPGKMLELRQ